MHYASCVIVVVLKSMHCATSSVRQNKIAAYSVVPCLLDGIGHSRLVYC